MLRNATEHSPEALSPVGLTPMDAAALVSPARVSPTLQQGLTSPTLSRSPRMLGSGTAAASGALQPQPAVAIEAIKVPQLSNPSPDSPDCIRGADSPDCIQGPKPINQASKPSAQTSAPGTVAWALPAKPIVTDNSRGGGGSKQPPGLSGKASTRAAALFRIAGRRRGKH